MNSTHNLSRKSWLSSQGATCLLVAGTVLAISLFTERVRATAFVSVASGNSSVAATWSPASVPTSADTVEIANGTIVTNVSPALNYKAVTVDVGGTFSMGGSSTFGTLTNNGTFSVANNGSARTINITTNFVNNGLINGNTGGQNVFSFNGGGLSTWTGSGDTTQTKVQLSVSATTTLDISGLTTPLTFKVNGTMASTISGKLITGTQVINGSANPSCTWTVASGGTMMTANTNGLINGSVGTLNFAGAVTLNAGANFIFNGSAPQSTLGLPGTVNNLTINDAAGVTLGAPVTINGTLALTSGTLTTTGATTPTVANVGSITGSGVVSGPLACTFNGTGSQTFPVSKGGNNRFVTINCDSLTGASTVTVEQIESAMGGILPSATSQFNNRFWTISESGAGGFTYDLTVDGTDFTPTDTAVMLQQGSPDSSFSTTFASPNYTTTGLTSFGNFTLGNFAPASDMLAFTTGAVTATAGVSSSTITVQLQTSAAVPKNATSNVTVNLSSTSAGGIFRNSADSATITSVTILSGTSTASFKYKDTIAPGAPTVTASASGVSPATQIETINVGSASKLAFSTQPVNTFLGSNMVAVVVQIEDAFNNNVAQSGTAVTLALSGDTLSSGTTVQNSDVNGQATFGDLVISLPGTNINFTATASGLTSGTSANFTASSQLIIKKDNNITMDNPASWFISGTNTTTVVPGPLETAYFNNSSVAAAPNNTPEFGNSATYYGVLITNWVAGASLFIEDATGGTLTLGPGGFYGTNVSHSLQFNPPVVLAAPQLWNWSGSAGSMAINGNSFDNGGFLLTMSGTLPISVSGQIIGAGGLTKIGGNTLTLSNLNTYTGPTAVNNGTLTVQGSLAVGSSVTVASGATLSGFGTIGDSVTVQNGGHLVLSPTLGTLTVNGSLTLQAGSSTSMVVDQTTSTNDEVAGLSSVSFGGTLTVTNLTGTPTVGETFTLFSAGSYSGNFSTIAGTPGSGLAWIFNPTNGVLTVTNSGVAVNRTNITAVFSGGLLHLSWPGDHLGWILQAQTNAFNIGITTNWVDVAGSGSSTNATITPNPAKGSAFFRLRSP